VPKKLQLGRSATATFLQCLTLLNLFGCLPPQAAAVTTFFSAVTALATHLTTAYSWILDIAHAYSRDRWGEGMRSNRPMFTQSKLNASCRSAFCGIGPDIRPPHSSQFHIPTWSSISSGKIILTHSADSSPQV